MSQVIDRTWLGYDRLMVVKAARDLVDRAESETYATEQFRSARERGDNKAARIWLGYIRNARYGVELYAGQVTREAGIAQQFVDCWKQRVRDRQEAAAATTTSTTMTTGETE